MISETYMARSVKQAGDHWKMIHDQEPPENFDRGVRALISGGVPATMIIGAINIAACRLTLEYVHQWAYICGIIRNETGILAEADEELLEQEPSRWSRLVSWLSPVTS
jgi:hypothetical protein